MAKPSVSAVAEWVEHYRSETVLVESGTAQFDDDYWRVTAVGKRPKYFYGETAWQDASRYASDLDWQAVVYQKGKQMTKQELIERLSGYSDDTELAFCWYDKEEIDEDMDDEEWLSVCDDLVTNDQMLEVARDVLMGQDTP